MTDGVASLGGVQIAPDGMVTYDFAGHIHATGVDLDEYTSGGGDLSNIHAVEWLDPAGQVREQLLGVLVPGIPARRSLRAVVGALSIELICDDGTSGFLQIVGNPKALRYHGRIALASFPPANPVDGDLVDVVIDATNGIVWRFLYNAGSASASKWEFIGGPPLTSEVATDEATASAVYVNLATVGPTVTIPRSGDYLVEYGAQMYNSAAGNIDLTSISIGGGAAIDGDAARYRAAAATTLDVAAWRKNKRPALVAGNSIQLKYRVTAGTGDFANRYLSVTPIRVS